MPSIFCDSVVSVAGIASLLVVVGLHAQPTHQSRISPFVVGGKDAKDKQFPDLVSLTVGPAICGGVIIHPEWILTAAHCVEGRSPEETSALAGTIDNEGGVRVDASEFHVHEGYRGPNSDSGEVFLPHDVALIKLKEKLPLSDKVRIAVLQRQPTEGGEGVVVAGWGLTSNEDDTSVASTLQYADRISIVPNDECKEAHGEDTTISDDQICAKADEQDQAACEGDSGGPLYHNGHVVGLVSWSVTPCGTLPTVYASVAAHLDWIEKQTNLDL